MIGSETLSSIRLVRKHSSTLCEYFLVIGLVLSLALEKRAEQKFVFEL